jgi:hypothetical protein
MSDKMLPLLGQSGLSPVMMTGEVVINARKDMQEYESRQGSFGPSGLIHVSHIAQNDMVFIRKGKQPTRMIGFGDNESAIDVFAGFDGIQHEDDDSFQFVGVARAPPMHQGMQGRETMEAGFALQIGGSRTLLCRSRQVIPIGSRLYWKIPRDDGIAVDTSKHGRVLAEICAYKPSDALLEPTMVHRMIKDVMGQKIQMSNLHNSDRAAHQNAMRIHEAFRAVAFSAVAVYLKHKAGGGGVVTGAALDEAAQMFRLMPIKSSDPNGKAKEQTAQETTDDWDDTLLQAEVDAQTGNSVSSANKTSYPMTIDGAYNPNSDQKKVAALQGAQYRTIYETMLTMQGALHSRKFAWTQSGGHPDGDIDVVLART